MNMTKIFHNPRCSKSRAAVALLESRGIDFEVVRYLENPPSPEELSDVVDALGVAPFAIVRKSEKLFKELGLDKQELDRAEWLSVLSENPKLIERPIVIHGAKAAIGRPTEHIEAIL